MITLEQFQELKIPIDNELMGNAALDWLADNTTLTVDAEDIETIKSLPASAKVFICKFCEITGASSIVASESIESLSQSFREGNKSDMVWDCAEELLGKYLKGRIRFVAAESKWR